MRFHNRRRLLNRRKSLRNNCTAAEAALWQLLKQRQLQGRKFRRQHSAGPFILDFYCPAERLAVEVDGPYHNSPEQAEYDARRTAYLLDAGIRVIRVRNVQVFDAPHEVLAYIASFFEEPQ